MDKIRVLVFPAGEINSIELHSALSTCKNIDLFGAASVDRHGPYIFKKYISGLPFINEDNFIDELNKVVNKYLIDLIIPTHDTVSVFLAHNKDVINTKVLTSDYETARICRSKKETYHLFYDCDFTPTVYKEKQMIRYPVFAKPDKGQGSKSSFRVDSEHQLESISAKDVVLCEYLPGDELTVDCITDRNGLLKGVFPRSRQRTFCGVSVAGEAIEVTPKILRIAEVVNERLKFLGLWYFQIKKDADGNWKLLEISTRCAGTMCLTRALGVNLPLLSVYTALGYDIEVTSNKYNVKLDRTLINRYKTNIKFKKVYLDFDDTLVIEEQVNLDIIRFVYQCLNAGKEIYLITKHSDDIINALHRYCISESLFADIINISPDDEKYKYLDQNEAIFIDNSYQERKLVSDHCNIPVFDVDTVEVLLDWRK